MGKKPCLVSFSMLFRTGNRMEVVIAQVWCLSFAGFLVPIITPIFIILSFAALSIIKLLIWITETANFQVCMFVFRFSIDLERWRRRNNVNEAPENVNSTGDDRPNDVNNIQERPHWLAIVWTFLSSFFLSLIPDQRDIPWGWTLRVVEYASTLGS